MLGEIFEQTVNAIKYFARRERLDPVRDNESIETVRSEFRRLKQLHRTYDELIFANSRLLPTSKTALGNESLSKEYWSHKRTGTSFDCCVVHRARKHLLIQQLCDNERTKRNSTFAHAPASISGTQRVIDRYRANAQRAVIEMHGQLLHESEITSEHTSDEQDPELVSQFETYELDWSQGVIETDAEKVDENAYPHWLVQGREFGPTDAAYLRYQLHVTGQKLNRMLKRAS